MPETLCSRLADLKTRLEADFFHIIGMGPAYGECIALRIPPKLWVAVDSFHMNGNQSPLRELLAGEEVSGLILTHPHDDHAPGLDQLIEDHPNAWVGCAAAWLDDWMDIDLMDAEAVQNSGASTHSLAALRRRWPTSGWPISRDSIREVGQATLTALHPGDSEVAAFRRRPRLNPNLLSSPLLVTWHNCQFVFGADLPARRWEKNLQGRDLGRHTLCKLPHHASKDAVSSVLLSGTPDRRWFTTPWNRKTGLPRFEDGQGMERWLRACDEVWLTALPYDLPNTPQRVERRTLLPGTSPLFPGARVSHPLQPAVPPCRGWVLYTFDQDGRLVRQEAGELARCIVEGL